MPKQMKGCIKKSPKRHLINYKILLPNSLLFAFETNRELDISSSVTSKGLFSVHPFKFVHKAKIITTITSTPLVLPSTQITFRGQSLNKKLYS